MHTENIKFKLRKRNRYKYKCNRQKIFDGRESDWYEDKTPIESWVIDDPNMPSWLKDYLKTQEHQS